ncbi:MAG: hypothetical protein KW804_00675 [Candidatus Doudnabacteria bacterium]|nr:hypothetical protein [Candidatus Doudnabacteria bacterium]
MMTETSSILSNRQAQAYAVFIFHKLLYYSHRKGELTMLTGLFASALLLTVIFGLSVLVIKFDVKGLVSLRFEDRVDTSFRLSQFLTLVLSIPMAYQRLNAGPASIIGIVAWILILRALVSLLRLVPDAYA